MWAKPRFKSLGSVVGCFSPYQHQTNLQVSFLMKYIPSLTPNSLLLHKTPEMIRRRVGVKKPHLDNTSSKVSLLLRKQVACMPLRGQFIHK